MKNQKFETGRKKIEAICIENNIEWHPLTYHKKPAILSTIKDILAIRKQAFQLDKYKKFCLVHCRSYISALIGLEMKRKKNVPFLFDMRGFYADERVAGYLWNLSNPIYKIIYWFFKSKEAAFVQHSAAIICLTEAAKKILLEWPAMKYSNK